ncbi:hypothetical protein DFJ43DRAFT_1093430 [Lentinula guzmanii]|uniref:Uncharacterized protein n=1 Tax=Lentinula guzmanii TaxID=2804957 RepID=A0AA38JDG8_9AGAR|nr:hypothetical protein DFJ43DRAFT_1093430 [Lentinula guzmanii]
MSPTPSSTLSGTITSTTSLSTSSSGSSDVVAEVIVGGVIAGVLLALIFVGLAMFLYQEYRRRKGNKDGSGRSRKGVTTRGKSPEGSDPLLYPTFSQVGQGEFNPYAEIVSLPVRPVRPEISLDYSEIDILEPLPSSSSVMQETSLPLSTARPSLSPLLIPHATVVSPAHPSPHPTTAPTKAPTPNDNNNDPSSAVSNDDTASESSMSAYSQASASTRLYKAWEEDTQFPPIPEIPSQHQLQYISSAQATDFSDENTSLTRGNTAKLTALLKSRARRAQRGKPLSRSSTKVSRIDRNNSLESIDLIPRNRSESVKLHRDPNTLIAKSPAPSEPASLTIRNPFEDVSSSSRSTSVTTSIANHAAQTVDPPYAHRLSVIDNEEAETQSVYADEISHLKVVPDTPPLRITKNQAFGVHS